MLNEYIYTNGATFSVSQKVFLHLFTAQNFNVFSWDFIPTKQSLIAKWKENGIFFVLFLH